MTKKSSNKIMVVEDEAVIALRLQQMLTKMGYDVTDMAHTGEEAIEKVRSQQPDLILMDIMIPGKLDGIEVAEILKEELDIPAIFLTAYSDKNIIERAKKVEPYGYIVKPFQDREIKAAIEVALYKKEMEKALQESRKRFRNLTEVTSDWIWEVDEELCYTYASPKIYDILGYDPEEIIGKTPFDLMPPEEADRVFKIFNTIRAAREPFHCFENINLHKNGHPVVLETSGLPIFNADGELSGYRGVDRDITQRKRVEEKLRKAHDELEKRVAERTRELEIKTKSLEDINTAMKVLLKKRENDKVEIEDNVLTNVKRLVEPILQKIKKTKLDDQQKAFLNIMETNLNEIISPFVRKMSKKHFNLTPQEIRIINLITQGNSTKNIAELLNLSPKTVETHRKNIRSKFGLQGKKVNLRSHLLSLNKMGN
jgi:PAS domain S-box-containing protein